jgi:hypothetical protein
LSLFSLVDVLRLLLPVKDYPELHPATILIQRSGRNTREKIQFQIEI